MEILRPAVIEAHVNLLAWRRKETVETTQLRRVDDKLRCIALLWPGSTATQPSSENMGTIKFAVSKDNKNMALTYWRGDGENLPHSEFTLEAQRNGHGSLAVVSTCLVEYDDFYGMLEPRQHVIGGPAAGNTLKFGGLMVELSLAHKCAKAIYSERPLQRTPFMGQSQ